MSSLNSIQHSIHKGNIYQIKKPNSSNNKAKDIKKISILEGNLYTEDDTLYLSLTLLNSLDSFYGLENPYEDDNFKQQESAPDIFKISEYRSCDISHEATSKEDPSPLHIIRLCSGLFSDYRGKSLRLWLRDIDQAESWHSILSKAVKCGGKWQTFNPRPVVVDTQQCPPSPAVVTTTISSDSQSVLPVDPFDFDMMDNDIYESTCPKDCFRATLTETESSKVLGLTGQYFLRVIQDNLDLLDPVEFSLKLQWAIKYIRKFNVVADRLVFEAGSSCSTGSGRFTFTVVNGKDLLCALLSAQKFIQSQQHSSKQIDPSRAKMSPIEPPSGLHSSQPIEKSNAYAVSTVSPIEESNAYAVCTVSPIEEYRFSFLKRENKNKTDLVPKPAISSDYVEYDNSAVTPSTGNSPSNMRALIPLPPVPSKTRLSVLANRNPSRLPTLPEKVGPVVKPCIAKRPLVSPKQPVEINPYPSTENASETFHQIRQKISQHLN